MSNKFPWLAILVSVGLMWLGLILLSITSG